MDRKGLFSGAATAATPSPWEKVAAVLLIVQALVLTGAGISGLVAFIRVARLVDRAEVVALRSAERIASAALTPASREAARSSLEYTASALAATPIPAFSEALGNVTLALQAFAAIDTAPLTNLTATLMGDPRVAVWARRLLNDVHRFQAIGSFAARAMATASCELAAEPEECGDGCLWRDGKCIKGN